MINSFRIDYHFNTRWPAIHKQIKIIMQPSSSSLQFSHTWKKKNNSLTDGVMKPLDSRQFPSPAIRTLDTSWCIIRKYIWLIDICSFCICAVNHQSSIRNQRLLYNKASDQGCYFFSFLWGQKEMKCKKIAQNHLLIEHNA